MNKEMIYNFTQHETIPYQKKFNIVDVPNQEYLKSLLTFDVLPDSDELEKRATLIADYATEIGAKQIMIGGALYLMPYLIDELNKRNIISYFAFSKRVNKEIIVNDETVIKKSKFLMEGLIKNK